MFKVTPCCDFCGKEVSDKELYEQNILMRSATKEIDLHLYTLCKSCASIIDYNLLKFKMENMIR